MPLYDYQCDDCGHLFEVSRKRTEPGPTECTECGAADPRRAISATSFQLKGSGWYVTDYKKSNAPEPTASKESTADSGATDSGSSEAAPAADSKPDEGSKSNESKDPAPAAKEVA